MHLQILLYDHLLGAKQVRRGCRQMEKGSFALHPCRNGPLHLPFLTSLTGN